MKGAKTFAWLVLVVGSIVTAYLPLRSAFASMTVTEREGSWKLTMLGQTLGEFPTLEDCKAAASVSTGVRNCTKIVAVTAKGICSDEPRPEYAVDVEGYTVYPDDPEPVLMANGIDFQLFTTERRQQPDNAHPNCWRDEVVALPHVPDEPPIVNPDPGDNVPICEGELCSGH